VRSMSGTPFRPEHPFPPWLDKGSGVTIQVMARLLDNVRWALQPSKAREAVRSRNHQFDLLRIIFATLVLLSHAPEITDGTPSREIFHRFTRAPMTFGTVGVDGFFLLSGYLIVQSWLANPELFNFLRKRVLRIVPGYLIAVIFSTLAVGLLAPGVPHFFRGLNGQFVRSVVLLSSPVTPSVFPGRPYALVNGAMYTIAYEFRCYLLVAFLGLCGLLRRPFFVLTTTILLLFSFFYSSSLERMRWPRHVEMLIGQPIYIFHLTAVYLLGCCFFLLRKRIAFRPKFSLAASLLMIACFVFTPSKGELAMLLCGGYLMFYFGQIRLTWLSGMDRFPDISYGIYLYGWPVESLWIWFLRGSPWVAFLGSTIICIGLGWLSWHFIERPALILKRRPSAPLPVASLGAAAQLTKSCRCAGGKS
jgi:peptidoglycan/LPS O-acetylase OafA/YrhL